MDSIDEARATYEKLKAEIDAIDAAARPLIERARGINARVMLAQAELRPITEALRKFRDADYVAKKKLLGQLAITLGGKKLEVRSS